MAQKQKRSERLQVMLVDTELKIIDEWRFNNRMPTRAAAIRRLIRLGLEASGYDPDEIVETVSEKPVVPPSSKFAVVTKTE